MKAMKGTKKKFSVTETLSTPPYGNWKVCSPDNILMFRCDNRKANWYLNRDLAEIIDDTTLRLKFEPKGLGYHGNPKYNLAEKKNICVVCGVNHNLTKHHVVPKEFRKYFPIELKRFNSHDVLVTCVQCHKTYERHSDVFKLQLAEKYNTHIAGSHQGIPDKELLRAKRFASFYLRQRENCLKHGMDQPYRLDAEKYLNKSILEATEEELIELVNKAHIIRAENYIPFGKVVVDSLTDMNEFCVEWRKHFLHHTQPKFLPEYWNINGTAI